MKYYCVDLFILLILCLFYIGWRRVFFIREESSVVLFFGVFLDKKIVLGCFGGSYVDVYFVNVYLFFLIELVLGCSGCNYY